MGENLKDSLAKWVTVAILAGIVIIGLLMIYPKFLRSQALRRENAELQEQIDIKKREIARLIDNQRRFRTDRDFVELIARQNHRIYPGELIFIFDDKE